MPAVQPEVQEDHWGNQIFEFLVMRGINPQLMVPNFEDGKGSHVALAMPAAKIALATDGDVYDNLLDDGWQVSSVPLGALKSFASTGRELTVLATNHRIRESGATMIKTGSEDEARLLNGILRAHLPPPDRNYRVMRPDDPGKELTVPDFTWPRHRVAFFMDGLWWHHGRDSDIQKKMLLGEANKETIEEAERQQQARATRDANNRSELTLMGWVVLSCSDEEIADDAGVKRQVDLIKRALSKSRAIAEEPEVDGTGALGADDLFGVKEPVVEASHS